MKHSNDLKRLKPNPSPLGILARPAVVGLALLGSLACSTEPAGPVGPKPNILLIAVDTLRADHLSAFGYERNTTPNIDKLAEKSLAFRRAYAPSPWTKPSVASIHTGLYPTAHTVERPPSALPSEVVTLAEILKGGGWRTASVTSNKLLDERYGFGQGFDSYDSGEAQGHRYVSTPGITTKAKQHLADFATTDEPFFLSLLYFDPHYDWRNHGLGIAKKSAGRLNGLETIKEMREMAATAPGMTEEEICHIRDRYDEEIQFTDAGIGEVLAELNRLGFGDNTIVVFTADHGEEFLEHGWLGHTRFLYEGMIHVPLLIFDPRKDAPPAQPLETPVSNVSVTPTIVDLAGFDHEKYAFGAPSLAPLFDNAPDFPFGPVFSEVNFVAGTKVNAEKESHLMGVIDGDIKFIRETNKPIYEAFNTRSDPLETQNLLHNPEGPALMERYKPMIRQWKKQQVKRGYDPRKLPYTKNDLEDLRALGYLDDGH